jgi:hypothetical protein
MKSGATGPGGGAEAAAWVSLIGGETRPMLSQARWEAECILMHSVFPEFRPFCENGIVGFRGYLRGPRSGRLYRVAIQASVSLYPESEPAVYMDPRAEGHHWIDDGRLCYQRDGRPWRPGRGTFANTLLIAADYVADFDS